MRKNNLYSDAGLRRPTAGGGILSPIGESGGQCRGAQNGRRGSHQGHGLPRSGDRQSHRHGHRRGQRAAAHHPARGESARPARASSRWRSSGPRKGSGCIQLVGKNGEQFTNTLIGAGPEGVDRLHREVQHEGVRERRRRRDAAVGAGFSDMMQTMAMPAEVLRGRRAGTRGGGGRPARRSANSTCAMRAWCTAFCWRAFRRRTPRTWCRTSSSPPCGSCAGCARRRRFAAGCARSRAIARWITSGGRAESEPVEEMAAPRGATGRRVPGAGRDPRAAGGVPGDADSAAGGGNDGAGDRGAHGADGRIRCASISAAE